ncbi:hypothetical protein [Desulfofundulus kuznetsovii]|jgi:hypothetical protein
MKEMVTLSQTELKRMLVLQRVLEGQVGALPLMTVPKHVDIRTQA